MSALAAQLRPKRVSVPVPKSTHLSSARKLPVRRGDVQADEAYFEPSTRASEYTTSSSVRKPGLDQPHQRRWPPGSHSVIPQGKITGGAKLVYAVGLPIASAQVMSSGISGGIEQTQKEKTPDHGSLRTLPYGGRKPTVDRIGAPSSIRLLPRTPRGKC